MKLLNCPRAYHHALKETIEDVEGCISTPDRGMGSSCYLYIRGKELTVPFGLIGEPQPYSWHDLIHMLPSSS
jgi:hypothetical protein